MGIYSCNQCNKTFSHETNLIRHIHGFHENKILECEVCGFKTSRKDSLKRHKNSKHGNANKLNPISFNCTSSVNEVANNGAYGGQTYHQPMVNSLTQPNLMYNHVQTQTIGDKKKQLTETLEFRLIPNKRMYMLKVNFQMIVHKKWTSREIAFIQIQKSY